MLTLLLKRKKIVKILKDIDKRFWKNDGDEDKVTRLAFWFNFSFMLGGSVLCFGFTIIPFMNSGRQLPIMCWTPDGNPSPYYEIIYAIQVYVFFAITGSVIGFDTLYSYINCSVYIQLKLLRIKLTNFIEEKERDTALKLKYYCQHHQFILE